MILFFLIPLQCKAYLNPFSTLYAFFENSVVAYFYTFNTVNKC